MWRDRTKVLIGESGVNKLKNSHVCIVGIGGVGGYVCTILARAGVGKMTLVDFDCVDVTNINRQVVAFSDTVGKLKTEVMRDLISKINPSCEVNIFSLRFDANLAEVLFREKFNYVIDAIDSVNDKVELIDYCKKHDINIISAMGAGNRKNIPQFHVLDIYKTSNDGLARVMRQRLRKRQVDSLDVVTSVDKAEKTAENVVGSISYYPAMCGCVLGAFVINKLIS